MMDTTRSELTRALVRDGLRRSAAGTARSHTDEMDGRSQIGAARQSAAAGEGNSGVRLVWSQATTIDRRTAKMRRPMPVLVSSR